MSAICHLIIGGAATHSIARQQKPNLEQCNELHNFFQQNGFILKIYLVDPMNPTQLDKNDFDDLNYTQLLESTEAISWEECLNNTKNENDYYLLINFSQGYGSMEFINNCLSNFNINNTKLLCFPMGCGHLGFNYIELIKDFVSYHSFNQFYFYPYTHQLIENRSFFRQFLIYYQKYLDFNPSHYYLKIDLQTIKSHFSNTLSLLSYLESHQQLPDWALSKYTFLESKGHDYTQLCKQFTAEFANIDITQIIDYQLMRELYTMYPNKSIIDLYRITHLHNKEQINYNINSIGNILENQKKLNIDSKIKVLENYILNDLNNSYFNDLLKD